MSADRTIVFLFAGRKPNVELQLPLIRRVLDEHADTEFHIWNLSKTDADDAYLRTIEGDGITVINDFHGANPWLRFNDVYRHYLHEQYRDARFVKIDDDVIFLETQRFSDFVEAIDANADSVISAKVINNGACTDTEDGLWKAFSGLGIPLLDVHESAEYAQACHDYALENFQTLIGQPLALVPTKHWLSINLIGYSWELGHEITQGLGHRSPGHIAGRNFRRNARLGDEGAFNRYPRKILNGFLAAHLYFGPQAKAMTDDVLDDLRKRYLVAGQQYLDLLAP